jgi:Fur family transcriptional regulator, peroxide stress response regulator
MIAQYRTLGLKLTPQRIAILDYLSGNTQHPSAEDIYGVVLNKFPTLSLATVYTTLGTLKGLGKVLELTIDPDKKRYDLETVKHNHFICISCKRIIDIPATHHYDFPEAIKQGFSIIASHIEYYGHCPECK